MSNQNAAKTVALPANPLCVDDPIVTLNSAHAWMELICALNCDDGAGRFEMPDSINVTLGHLRDLVRDSIKYAQGLMVEEVMRPAAEAEERAEEAQRARGLN